MPSIFSWLWMAPDTVTIEPYVSQNKNGEATYGTAVSYRARVQDLASARRPQRVITLAGDERFAAVQVDLMGTPSVSVRDRITLPSRFAVTQPPILAVTVVTDQNGPHHVVAYT